MTVVFLFWIPGAALLAYNWKSLDRPRRKAFWITCAIMAVVTVPMEYVYLWADIWDFSEAHDPLLGVRIFGAPVEEFTFWFGAAPFVLGVYRFMHRFDRGKAAGARSRVVRKRA